jgi:hypothetical protein
LTARGRHANALLSEGERRAQKAADKQRYRRLYLALQEKPAPILRATAVEQRDQAAAGLRRIRDLPGELLHRWRSYDDRMEEIAWFLREGDEELDGTQKRRLYARAYLRGREVAEAIDTEKKLGSTYVVLLEDSAESAIRAGKWIESTAGKGYRAVKSLGGGALLVLGGLVLLNLTKK